MKQRVLDKRERLKAIALIEGRGIRFGVHHHADTANLVGGPTGERQGESQQCVADPAALRLFSDCESRHPEHGQGITRELTAAIDGEGVDLDFRRRDRDKARDGIRLRSDVVTPR